MPGSYRKRGKKYYLEVTITDYSGKLNRFSKTCDLKINTDTKAEKELAKFYAACVEGKITKQSSLTISDMCDLVMEKIAVPTLKRNTVRGYKTCKKRIDATIGDKKMAKLKPIHVQDWVNELRDYGENGLSPKTIKNTYSFLRMCFGMMVEWGELDKSPCVRIRLPKPEPKEIDILTKDEVVCFLNNLDRLPEAQQDYKVAALLALFCGLRRGEICGIDEDSVDLEQSQAQIRKAHYIDDAGVYEDTPKSKAAYRTIVFPKEVSDEIQTLITFHKKRKLLLGTKWQESSALIKGAFGNAMYPNNLWDWLTQFLDQNNMRHFSFHALRHTYTSMLGWMKKDIAEISKSLGHSKQSTTLNTYMHMFQDLEEAKRKTASDLSEQIIRLKAGN